LAGRRQVVGHENVIDVEVAFQVVVVSTSEEHGSHSSANNAVGRAGKDDMNHPRAPRGAFSLFNQLLINSLYFDVKIAP